jgi:hypothetical protein
MPTSDVLSVPGTFGIIPPPPATTVTPSNTFGIGLGLEEHLGGYLGVGIDGSGILPGTGKVFQNTIGTFSPNVYAHLPHDDWPSVKFDLYGTGGYSVLFQGSASNGFNAGGGVNYWFKYRLGVLTEFRFLRAIGDNPPKSQNNYYQIRIGLAFR